MWEPEEPSEPKGCTIKDEGPDDVTECEKYEYGNWLDELQAAKEDAMLQKQAGRWA
jgi:hypothetical protein